MRIACLRHRHLEWYNEKINVRLAVQTLSDSMANALNWLEFDVKDPLFKRAQTATF